VKTPRPRNQRTSITSPITTGTSRSRLDDSQISISPMFITTFYDCAGAINTSNPIWPPFGALTWMPCPGAIR
jgi:hypothetical protein